ncbi:MAG: hypothetical protein LJE97_08395 [Betaproteobacteria bacterium]|jgi:hypothetical protein|nr:hypothetical protein [Betaproteobacteria bacterium]
MSATRSKALNLLPPMAMLAFSIGFLGWAYTYGERAQQMPVLVGWIMSVLCALDVVASSRTRAGNLVRALFAGTRVDRGAVKGTGKPIARSVVSILWPTAFISLVAVFGFLPVIPVYVFLFVVLQGRKSVRQGLAAATFTTALTFVLFKLALGYEVYQGLLFSG